MLVGFSMGLWQNLLKVLSFDHPAAFEMQERVTSLEIAAEVLTDRVLCAEKRKKKCYVNTSTFQHCLYQPTQSASRNMAVRLNK